jgi:hypothetical protein
MTIHEYLSKAIQDDAQRRGERDRLLREARRARRARRQRLVADQLADERRASPTEDSALCPKTVTSFSTASRAHLRRAGPDGLDVNRENRARSTEWEMSGQRWPAVGGGVSSGRALVATLQPPSFRDGVASADGPYRDVESMTAMVRSGMRWTHSRPLVIGHEAQRVPMEIAGQPSWRRWASTARRREKWPGRR